jgi:hypothetical protein
MAHPCAPAAPLPAAAEARLVRQEEESALHASKHLKTEPREAGPAAGPAAGAGASTSSEGDSHSEDGGGGAAAAAGGPAGGGAKPKRQRKIPKLPMVRHCKKWYRARLLKEATARVLLGARCLFFLRPPASTVAATGPAGLGSAARTPVPLSRTAADVFSKWVLLEPVQACASGVACGAAEFTGFEEQTGSLWLPKDSDRIWRGSYKGRDWRYLVRPARGARRGALAIRVRRALVPAGGALGGRQPRPTMLSQPLVSP